jgi:uncharacterized protein (TIGR02145 family)
MRKPVSLLSFLLINLPLLIAQTPERGTVKDIESNEYPTILTGKYEWMAANLKTTTFRDGTKIPVVQGSEEWSVLIASACCMYNNSESSADTFGVLYNWHAVNTGNLCPDGWRVPSDEEWKYMEGFADTRNGVGDTLWNHRGLRGFDAGLRLRTSSGWYEGRNGTDDLGFSALPAGERLSRNGRYFISGRNGFWWTSTGNDSSTAWYRCIIYAYDQVMRGEHDKRFGFSVRCIKNP